MGYPPIRKGVSLIAGHVAKLPLYVYRTAGDGSRKKDMRHPAYRLLMRSPSDLYSPFVFRQQMTAYVLIYGNAFAWISRDQYGLPQELSILHPENTWVKWKMISQSITLG